MPVSGERSDSNYDIIVLVMILIIFVKILFIIGNISKFFPIAKHPLWGKNKQYFFLTLKYIVMKNPISERIIIYGI